MIMIMTMMWSHGFVFSIICICVVPWILGSKQMISRSGKYKSECRIVKCFRPLRFPPERRLNVFTKNIPDTWKIIISFRRVCHDGWWFRDSHKVFLISPNFTPDAGPPQMRTLPDGDLPAWVRPPPPRRHAGISRRN